MNKEDILKMSRDENQNGDEREEKIKLHSYAVSASVGALICMVFVLIESFMFDRSTATIWTIYSGMMFSKSLLDAIKIKKKADIGLSVIWGICCILNVIVYILDNIG